MDLKSHQEVISIIFVMAIIIGLYLLQTMGVVTLSDVGAAIAAVLIAAVLGVLWWGWRDRINQWLGKSTHQNEATARGMVSNNIAMRVGIKEIPEYKNALREEFNSFVEPLYLEFKKNPSLMDDLLDDPIRGGYQSSDWNKVAPVILMFRERGYLAQPPQLQKLVENLLKYKDRQIENKNPLELEELGDIVLMGIQIEDLIKKRYNELNEILRDERI